MAYSRKRALAAQGRSLRHKSKCLDRKEFGVVGWIDPEGSRRHLGSTQCTRDRTSGEPKRFERGTHDAAHRRFRVVLRFNSDGNATSPPRVGLTKPHRGHSCKREIGLTTGATELEIRAITSHQTSREVSRYTKAANQKPMAKSAMEKLTRNKIVPLKTNGSVPPRELEGRSIKMLKGGMVPRGGT